MRGQSGKHPLDGAIAELARRQHGLVERTQLRALGLGEDAIDWRVRRERLHRVYQGVYAVGHLALTRNGQFMAAVLACGQGAALSHFSAAVLWEILEAEGQRIHVTVPGNRVCRGVIVHRSALEASGCGGMASS
jgi:predicted transcriptional regulator of viral defense system